MAESPLLLRIEGTAFARSGSSRDMKKGRAKRSPLRWV